MASRKRVRSSHLLIGLGLVLVLNPLYVGALHLDDPDWYRYESARIEFTDDGIEFPDGAVGGPLDSEVACLNDHHRSCMLEWYVREHGGLAYPDHRAVGPGEGYRYVYLNGSFYGVVPRTLGGNGTITHQSMPTSEVLEYVSTSLSDSSQSIRTAVRSGSVETHRPLAGANELVRDGGEYYVVHRTAARTKGDGLFDRQSTFGQGLETVVSMGGIAGGLWMILRGQRRRVLEAVRSRSGEASS